MPKSVPLRAIVVTTVEPGMPSAARVASLQAGIPRLRKKCSLAPEKRTASATSAGEASAVIMPGSSSRRSMSEPARLRLCPSSPIWSIWAMIARTSTGPVLRTAWRRIGPSTSPIQRSRSMTSGPYAP